MRAPRAFVSSRGPQGPQGPQGVPGNIADAPDYPAAILGLLTRANLPAEIAYEDEANLFTLQNRFTGDGGASTSIGGSVLVNPDGGTGAGVVIYSNRGADAAGRLLVVRADNAANPQQAVRVEQDGTGHAISVSHNPAGGAGDATAEALDIISTNTLDTTVGIQGAEEAKATVKITHEKAAGGAGGSDAAAAVLRLNWETSDAAATAVQGIYAYSEDGSVTTGDLIEMYSGPSAGNNPKFKVTAAGEIVGDGLLVTGGPDAADVLTLRAASHAAASGNVIVDLLNEAQALLVTLPATITTVTPAAIRVGQGDTMDIGNAAAWRALLADPTITYSSNTPNNVPLQVFTFGPQITVPTSPVQMRGAGIFRDLPTFNMTLNVAHGSVSTSGRPWVTLRHQPIFAAQVGAETATYPTLKAVAALATVGAGWTITDYLVHHVEVPAGTGTITNIVAHEIDDYGTRAATLALSVRSKGADVEMRHAGPVYLGASTVAPVTLLHIGAASASFHGSITLDEETTDAAQPTADNQARIYVKNNKLVVQWNLAGTTVYTTVPLNTAGPYPVNPVWTTDVAAP